MMNTLIDNWYIYVTLASILIIGTIVIVTFFKQPTDAQIKKVREWLLIAVTEAEVQLGSGTGKLKLSYVYDLFISRFKWVSTIMSFEMFSAIVDEVLKEMRGILNDNPEARKLIVERKDSDVLH